MAESLSGDGSNCQPNVSLVEAKWNTNLFGRLVEVKTPVVIEFDAGNSSGQPVNVIARHLQEEELGVEITTTEDKITIKFEFPHMGFWEVHVKLGDVDILGSPFLCVAYSEVISPEVPTNWKKGKRLGRGGFGVVYLGYDEETGRELAVKQIVVDETDPDVCREVNMLEREFSMLKDLDHNRIVEYFGSKLEKRDSSDETYLSIFMEYVPGGSVKDHMKTFGQLTESVTAKYTQQVVEGLIYLHHKSIIHRGIKCANILRFASGNIKLADFGGSKHLTTICTATAQAATLVGTLYWTSPEMIKGEKYSFKTDIWSLGCTAVEMITGNPPGFEYKEAPAIIKNITNKDPLEYHLPENVSDDLKEFLKLCFVKDQTARPSTNELSRHKFLKLREN